MNHYNKENTKPTQGLVIEYKLNKEIYMEMMNKFLLFKDTDKEWAEFILNNRAKKILIPEAKHNKKW
jgi:hypothetical protein